ncbi:MAG: hypothetical protein WBP22_04545 [Candidatus Saccharimonas sp.]
MELDTNNATRGSADIDDEKRLSAATKRVTLAPLHEDVHPELKPDGSSEGEYGLDAPVANVPSDMENTSLVAKAPSTVPDETVVPPSVTSPAATTAVQPPTSPSTSAATSPSADFLPTAPPVTKKRKTVPIIIAVTGVVAVIAASLITYVMVPR